MVRYSSQDKDPKGRYVISYKIPNPCVRPEQTPIMRTSVTGWHNMQVTKQTLKSSGCTVTGVRRTNWFS